MIDMDENNFSPVVQPPKPAENKPPTTVGSWFLMIFLTFIPFVNIVTLLYLALSTKTEPGLKNWAAACIIWVVIGTAIFSIAGVFIVRWLLAY